MNQTIRIILLSLFSISIAACSVVMAAKDDGGVEPKSLSKCKDRNCLISNRATPISHKSSKKNVMTSEVFRANMPTGSAARAAMHGLLDVSTVGLWEVVGTPIEAVKNKKKSYVVDVAYANDGQTIKRMSFNF